MLPGETVIDAVVAPPGLHTYAGEEAEVVAVNVADPPAQIVADVALNVNAGRTVTVPELLPVQKESVTVTE